MTRLFPDTRRGVAAVPLTRGNPRLQKERATVDGTGMGHPQRIHTYDDELHERRRHLAVVREPLDFEAERLRRLQEKSKDTVNP
jgi:hypothetical protein